VKLFQKFFASLCIGADFHRAMVAIASGEKTPHMAPPCEELDPATNFFFVSL